MNNKTALILASVCLGLGIFSIPQRSQAVVIGDILDEAIKRGTCAIFQSSTKGCQNQTETSPTPTPTSTPEPQTTGEPQNTPTDSNTRQPSESSQ
jgi:hypothetical protein